jgi:hypothetical protein
VRSPNDLLRAVDSSVSVRRGVTFPKTRFWPAVLVTLLTGAGFTGLKFVLIGELAFGFSLKEPLPFEWLDQLVRTCIHEHTFDEFVAQGLAAMLTLGVLVGYAINAPLAGAWRVGRLFFLSCAGVAAGALATAWVSGWLLAALIGVAYGAACAARGKAIPLLSRATGRSNTLVSGLINASLVIGLLAGTVLGNVLKDDLDDITAAMGLGDLPQRPLQIASHGILFVIMVAATLLSVLVRPPEPRPTPFVVGVRELASGTATMLRQHWALLVSGGLAWGIASAASLAVFIDGVDRLHLHPTKASFMAIYAAIGAILGNVLSHYLTRRRQVMLCFLGLAICIAAYPHLVRDYSYSIGDHEHKIRAQAVAGMMMVFVGAFFAAPTNVLDARLLALAGDAGLAGRGSTVMSLVHNVFIFLVGTGLAIPLLLTVMTARDQFHVLAAITLVTLLIASRARLRDAPPLPVTTGGIAAPTGVSN